MNTSVVFSSIKESLRIKQTIISNIKGATVSIKVAVAWLTDEDIIRSLSHKKQEGVIVKIVISNSKENFINTNKFKKFLLIEGGLYIAHAPFMHNKFCIIDDRIIINGSYNWSYSAMKSEENIMIFQLEDLEEDKDLLKKFNVKFDYLYSKCSFEVLNMTHLNKFRNIEDSLNLIMNYDESEILLRKQFEEDVESSINKSKEKININYLDLLDRMRLDGGGVNFVKRLIHDEISSGEMKSGFKKLESTIPHSIELSLEYLVSRPKYVSLFSESEIQFCTNLMKKYNL